MKKWFGRITPFAILSVLALLAILYELIIERGGPDGWGYLAVAALLPALLIMIIVDVGLKYFIRKKTYWIWIIEVILIFGTMYAWIVS